MQTKSIARSRTASAPRSFASRAKTKAAPTRDQIARRAYEIYLARGKNDGREQDDWLQAERELMGSAHNGN